MKACSEYDDKLPMRCKSGHAGFFPVCRGINSEAVPYRMREDPPEHLTRSDGYPPGWPGDKKADPTKEGA